MDRKLKELKTKYERSIPTEFTHKDKKAVLSKIQNKKERKNRNHMLPKTLTGMLSAAVLLFGFFFMKDFLLNDNLEETNGGNASAPNENITDETENITDKTSEEPSNDKTKPYEDYVQIKHETTIELSDELITIYNNYKNTLNEDLLTGLEPIDIFKLYMYTWKENDREVEYGLLIKGDKYGTPDKDTYLNDPYWKPTSTMIEGGKKLYQHLQTIPYFTEIVLSETERLISFPKDDEHVDFRLILDDNTGIWKVPLLAMQ